MFFQKMTFLNEPELLNSNANFLTKKEQILFDVTVSHLNNTLGSFH